MKLRFSIFSALLVLPTIILTGCGGPAAQNVAPVAKPKVIARLPVETDIVAVWKGARIVNPQGEFIVPGVINQFHTETREFKPDHTVSTKEIVADPKGNWPLEGSGTWSLDGSTVVYTLPAVMNLPPIVTPLKWQNGTLTEMRDTTVQFIFEKQPQKSDSK